MWCACVCVCVGEGEQRGRERNGVCDTNPSPPLSPPLAPSPSPPPPPPPPLPSHFPSVHPTFFFFSSYNPPKETNIITTTTTTTTTLCLYPFPIPPPLPFPLHPLFVCVLQKKRVSFNPSGFISFYGRSTIAIFFFGGREEPTTQPTNKQTNKQTDQHHTKAPSPPSLSFPLRPPPPPSMKCKQTTHEHLPISASD